jgi:non-heme chloroperoxidase
MLDGVDGAEPEKIAGMIYLDAGYYYAYYDPVRGSPGLDILDLQRKLRRLLMGPAMTRREQD